MSSAFPDHFSSFANRYVAFRPHYPSALFDYLASLTPRATTVWDCAAGSGQATVDLAKRFRNVIATDGSADQIRSAPRRDNVNYRVALAEQSGLPDASVDLITVAQALHWFNRDRFFAEAKRVLKPAGVLAVWTYAVNQVEGEELNQLVQDFYANIVGPYWPPERQLTENGYRSIAFPFIEGSPPTFCMEARWTLDQLLGYFGTWSATNRFIKANGHNPIEPLREAMAKVWGDRESTRLVVWPLSLRLGTSNLPAPH